MQPEKQGDAGMRRLCGIAMGVITHALFFLMVYRLFWFLKGDDNVAPRGPLWVDGLLALQFAVVHSLLLLPAVKARLTRLVPAPFYGCFYCLIVTLGLLVLIAGWRTSPVFVWHLQGWPRFCVQCAYFASWAALLYCFSLTGFGYQTGWTPWWAWVRGRPQPVRRFEPRSVYRLLRHPSYLCFLGLIWFNPSLSLDRALLTGVWTLYVFVGSYLKDRRLVYYVGDPYRQYQERVPGYPGMPFGPLARVSGRMGHEG
jgi:methanethiol S-methyltransferase